MSDDLGPFRSAHISLHTILVELHAHIGDIKIGKAGFVLKALLGSCVGIAFLYRPGQVCGIAHCFLPTAPESSSDVGARYVSQAIPSLLALMHIRETDYKSIQAVLVGGGNMANSSPKEGPATVGAMNAKVALTMLTDLRIPIIHRDVGGDFGRVLEVNCNDYSFKVGKIPRLEDLI